MTAEMFDNAINGIRPELIEEAAHISPIAVKKPIYKYAAAAAVFALCVVGWNVVSAHFTHTVTTNLPDVSDIGVSSQYGGNTSSSLYENTGDNVSATNKPIIKGTAYTNDEVVSLIEANKNIIALNISAEYGRFGDEVQIFTKGYYHTILGEINCVDLDYLTLPVCIDNQIVGNVEVFRNNGEVMYTLNTGGDKWDVINEALAYSDNIAFVFGGNNVSEIAVSPDNTVFEITKDAKYTLTGGYDLIATEYNTFSKATLYEDGNCIVSVSNKELNYNANELRGDLY